MFDGMPEEFHQFTTTRNNNTSSPSIHHHHLPFTPQNNTTFTPFDPYSNNHPSSHHIQLLVQPPPNNNNNNLLHPLPLHVHHHHHSSSSSKLHHEDNNQENNNSNNNNNVVAMVDDPWSNEEVLALLRIRSTMDTWFPHQTWEHVSRKMAEVGYKRSAENCKDKFEQESRYFTNINHHSSYGSDSNSNKANSYRGFLGDLEEQQQHLYHHHHNSNPAPQVEKPSSENEIIMEDPQATEHHHHHHHQQQQQQEQQQEQVVMSKRKRVDGARFEMFKGFCESIVHKMMEQQEELHNKLISDMLRRDQEKLAREEAWKKQEIERMNVELDIMAKEQAVAGNRHATIIHFLDKFSPQNQSLIASATTTTTTTTTQPDSNNNNNNPQNPNPHPTTTAPSSPPPAGNNVSRSLAVGSTAGERDDIGRRWPKDEVLALINLRCSSQSSSSNEENVNSNNKAPLWERISQGMMELGYKRSAKRCKEKWENINKYFRKTKDGSKKRSLDSRTCPYFHLLSNLYSQGKLVLLHQQQQQQPPHEVDIQTNNARLPHDLSQVGPPPPLAADDDDGGGL